MVPFGDGDHGSQRHPRRRGQLLGLGPRIFDRLDSRLAGRRGLVVDVERHAVDAVRPGVDRRVEQLAELVGVAHCHSQLVDDLEPGDLGRVRVLGVVAQDVDAEVVGLDILVGDPRRLQRLDHRRRLGRRLFLGFAQGRLDDVDADIDRGGIGRDVDRPVPAHADRRHAERHAGRPASPCLLAPPRCRRQRRSSPASPPAPGTPQVPHGPYRPHSPLPFLGHVLSPLGSDADPRSPSGDRLFAPLWASLRLAAGRAPSADRRW